MLIITADPSIIIQ